MDCPNCQTKMNEIATKSKYGAKIFIDQCPNCGGLWFDGMEMYQVQKDTADLIDKIDKEKLIKNTVVKKNILCPKDSALLRVFSDLNFPAFIKVESCPQCGGFFFNRGEYKEFYEERQKRTQAIKKEEESEFAKNTSQLLESHSSASTYDTIGQVGRFLSQPYNYSSAGINMGAQKADKAISAAAYIIYALLRLFLR